MSTVTLEEAQAHLPELISQLTAGDALIITSGQQPVAQLTSVAPTGTPVAGRCKGMLTIVAEDDDHLADFREYMP